VFLKTADSGGRCLDDGAASNGGAAKVVSCNGGNYQIWEVFYQDSGARMFKSWGAWTEQQRHLCLSYLGDGYSTVGMSTCDAASDRQQWYVYG
jgi:hypothetical protein